MPSVHTVNWWEVDKLFDGLQTDLKHEVAVQREAIPLIFVPGIMGSRLRSGSAKPTADGKYPGDANGLPVMRWDPAKRGWMARNYLWSYAKLRKKMLIGTDFNAGYLEVANPEPVGDGFIGIMDNYRPFLESLRDQPWGQLGKIFEFPVYAFGYNWTDSAEAAGLKLRDRIVQVIAESKGVVGLCEKVILISHSMGGLVSRACSELVGARGNILGIVHGVQPATGASAAYWRIKAGFEVDWKASASLGNDGKDVTVVLANSPGGLQLLPNQHHRTNAGDVAWLKVTKDGKVVDGIELPRGPSPDPYADIYGVPAVVVAPDKSTPSGNAYWGLVDPNLLSPGTPANQASTPGSLDEASDSNTVSPWAQYMSYLAIAKSFHSRLGVAAHPHTFSFAGTGHTTTDIVEMQVEWRGRPIQNYRTRGFAGEYTDADGWDRKAILQDPSGTGDGTVPLHSSRILFADGKARPGDQSMALEHQPAFENSAAQDFTRHAIQALCLVRYNEKRGGK